MVRIVKATRNNDSGRPALELELDVPNMTRNVYLTLEMGDVQYRCIRQDTEFNDWVVDNIIDQIVQKINQI
jgi:hypothetical protein